MSKISDRLRKLRIDAGFESGREVARRFGWNENTYRSHENGSRGVPRDALFEYAKAYKVDVSWLVTGVHESSPSPEGGSVSVRIIDWADLPTERGQVLTQIIQAGGSGTILLSGRDVPADCYALVVRDDAMVSDKPDRNAIYPRDTVIISPQGKLQPNKTAVVWDADREEHILRRIEYKSRTIINFVAANQAYPSLTLPMSSPHILGVVIGVHRSV